jgi:bifunctional DNA-binding transcriptional regulator/antitoxin component of YhaV-PrlF toxin-antitoxin module
VSPVFVEEKVTAEVPMLQGKVLLDKARSLSNRPEDQIARACGYVGPSGRVLKKSFYRALVEAKGYSLPSANSSSGSGSKGRQAEFRTRVHGNGNLLIGHAYTRRMGLEPGQEFKIEIHQETGAIWLLPLEANGVLANGVERNGGLSADTDSSDKP